MILRLIILLLIVGCGTEPEDCAGVAGGNAYLDDCGGCDANTTNDNTTCEQDCAGVWGGTADYDECGVCGGDDYNEDGYCQLDLDVLQDFIDINESLSGEPLEIGVYKEWSDDGYLIILNLSNNQLTSIPESIGNLSNLDVLALYNNQLTTLPESIVNLSSLRALSLHHNQLTTLPDNFCELEIANWNPMADSFSIKNNNICPPYPECIEDYMGEQDTSNCP